jgi:hypothetical protein
MINKLFIEGANYYQFAAVVEDEILTQAFPALDGQPVALSSRRTFNPSETANRLEIGIDGDFIHPITLDCRPLSNDRLMVTPACRQDSYQPVLDELLRYIRLFWGIPQPEPEPTQTEDLSSPAQPSRKVERSMNVGTAQAVAKAKLLISTRGLTKTAACGLVGIDRRTYNRWCDHEAVSHLVENGHDHPPGP